jgi:hypothetical protein
VDRQQVFESTSLTLSATIDIDTPLDQTHRDLSPDGTRIAVVMCDVDSSARIQTITLKDGTKTGQARLLQVSDNRHANVFREQPGSFARCASPSPGWFDSF